MLVWIKSKIYFKPNSSPCLLNQINLNYSYINYPFLFDLSNLEDVKIYKKNSVSEFIHGWFFGKSIQSGGGKSKNERNLIIVSHGNAGCVLDRCYLVKQLGKHFDADIFCYDYSGFGSTTHKYWLLSENTLQLDCRSVIQHFIDSGYSKANIILYGESIGVPIACHSAYKMGIDRLILQSGPASIKDVAKYLIGVPLTQIVSVLVWNDFSTKNYLKNLKKANKNAKVIVLHSPTDEVVNYQNGKILEKYGAILIDIEGSHNNTKISSTVWKMVNKNLFDVEDTKASNEISKDA
jgi:predicted esterase YcpF (UPF0227 family)